MSSQHPASYLRIAAELREQIATGELPPGSRLPSTREITRRWGVAMATATKVISALRQEGLVSVLPGVGTVVTPASGAPGQPPDVQGRHLGPPTGLPSSPRQSTSASEAIVIAAIAVADAEGIATLSMRRIAAEVGAATMSLYRHVRDKDDLLDRMITTSVAGWPFPAAAAGQPLQSLHRAARALWAMFREHPWLAPALSLTRPEPIAGGLPFMESVLASLEELGLRTPDTMTAYITLFDYVRGTAMNLEFEREAEATSGLDNAQFMATRQADLDALLAGGRFPVAARFLRQRYTFDLDEVFGYGLDRLLDGIAAAADREQGRG